MGHLSATLRNLKALLIEQGSRHLLGLLVLPYLLHIYSPGDYGPLLMAQALAGIMMVLADYGFNITAVQAIAEHRENRAWCSRISGEVLVLRTALGGLLWPLYLGLIVALHLPLGYALACYLPVFTGAWFPNWIFYGVERMAGPARLQIAGQVLFVAGIFGFVHAGMPPVAVAWVQAAVSLFVTGTAWIFLQQGAFAVHWRRPSLQRLRQRMIENFPIALGITASVLFTTGNTFVIGAWGTAALAGLFGVAWKFFGVLLAVIGQTQTAAYPRLSRLRRQDPEAARRFFWEYLGVLLLVFSGIALGAQFLLPLVLPWVTGSHYPGSLVLIQILVYALPAVVLNFMLTNFLFLNRGRYWAFSGVLVSTAIWDLCAIGLSLYWHLGPAGLGWAYVSTELFETGILVTLSLYSRYRTTVPESPCLL